jgi:hypothetical protein
MVYITIVTSDGKSDKAVCLCNLGLYWDNFNVTSMVRYNWTTGKMITALEEMGEKNYL